MLFPDTITHSVSRFQVQLMKGHFLNVASLKEDYFFNVISLKEDYFLNVIYLKEDYFLMLFL